MYQCILRYRVVICRHHVLSFLLWYYFENWLHYVILWLLYVMRYLFCYDLNLLINRFKRSFCNVCIMCWIRFLPIWIQYVDIFSNITWPWVHIDLLLIKITEFANSLFMVSPKQISNNTKMVQFTGVRVAYADIGSPLSYRRNYRNQQEKIWQWTAL